MTEPHDRLLIDEGQLSSGLLFLVLFFFLIVKRLEAVFGLPFFHPLGADLYFPLAELFQLGTVLLEGAARMLAKGIVLAKRLQIDTTGIGGILAKFVEPLTGALDEDFLLSSGCNSSLQFLLGTPGFILAKI